MATEYDVDYEAKKHRVVHPNGAQCKKGKKLSSKNIAIIPQDTIVIVEEINGSRCHISSPTNGWISFRTRDNYIIIVQEIIMTQLQNSEMFFVGQQITCRDTRYRSKDKMRYHEAYIDKVQSDRVFVVFKHYDNPSQGDWISQTEWVSRIRTKTIPINNNNNKPNRQNLIHEMPSINMTSNIMVTHKHISMWSVQDVTAWTLSLNSTCADNGGLQNQKQHIIQRIKKKKITGKDLIKCTQTKHLLALFGTHIITESTAGLLLIELEKEALKYEEITTTMIQNKLSATASPISPIQKSYMNKHIYEWSKYDLQQWISSIGLIAFTQRKINDTIDSDDVNGRDFNSLQSASDIVDSYEFIDNYTANKIFMELLKYRQIHTKPVCICGTYLQKLWIGSIYGADDIICDLCRVTFDGTTAGFVYHCSTGKNAQHLNGYNLCLSCANISETSDEIDSKIQKQSIDINNNIMPPPPMPCPLAAIKSQSLDTFQTENVDTYTFETRNRNGFNQQNIQINDRRFSHHNNNYYNSQQKTSTRTSAPPISLQPHHSINSVNIEKQSIDINNIMPPPPMPTPLAAIKSQSLDAFQTENQMNRNGFNQQNIETNNRRFSHHSMRQNNNKFYYNSQQNTSERISAPPISLQPQLRLQMSETDDHYASATIEESINISASVSNINGQCSKIGCNCNSFTPNRFSKNKCMNCHHDEIQHSINSNNNNYHLSMSKRQSCPAQSLEKMVYPNNVNMMNNMRQPPPQMQLLSNEKSQSYNSNNSVNRNQFIQQRQTQNIHLKNRYPQHPNGYNINMSVRNGHNPNTSPRRASAPRVPPNKKLPTLMKRLITEKKIELEWNIGDHCEIYSDSSKTWCPGKIESIQTDYKGKCYRIAYSKNGISGYYKNIPINLENINETLRVVSKNRNQSFFVSKNISNNWKKGDECDIFSSSSKQWCNGKVVYVSGKSLVGVEYYDEYENKKTKTVQTNDKSMIRRPQNIRQKTNEISQKINKIEKKQNEFENMLSELELNVNKYIHQDRQNHENKLQKHINTIDKDELKRIFYHAFVTKISMAFFDAKLINSKFVENNISFENKYANYGVQTFGLVVKVFQEVPLVATILDLTKYTIDKTYNMLVLEKAAKNKMNFQYAFANFNAVDFAQNIAVKIVNSECILKEIKQYKWEKNMEKRKDKIKEIAKKYGKYLISLIATGEAQIVVNKLNEKNEKYKYIDVLSMAILMQSNDKIKNAKKLNLFKAKELNSTVTNDIVALIKEIWNEFGTNTFWKKFTNNALSKISKFKP